MVLVKDVVLAVSRMCRVEEDAIYSKRRVREVSFARFMAYYFARRVTEMSLPRLGLAFGNRDHTSVLHGLRRMDKFIPQIIGWDEVEKCFFRMLNHAMAERRERQKEQMGQPLWQESTTSQWVNPVTSLDGLKKTA